MKVLFLDSNGEPVSYTLDPKKEIWQQSAGNKQIPIRSVIFWDRLSFIGGVLPVAEKCEVQIQPTSGNMNTIGVRYVVTKGGVEYVGFGSANDYSTIKTEKIIRDRSGNPVIDDLGKPKLNISGSVRYAVEMAVKRARNNAIAAALRLTNDAAPDYEESFDFIINPGLREKVTKNYKAPDMSVTPLPDDYSHEQNYNQPTTAQKPQQPVQPQAKPATATAPVAPVQKPTNSPAPQKPQPSTAASDGDADNFKFTFGKHNGKTMLQVLHEDASYIEWLAKESNKEDIKAKANAVLTKYQDLAKVKGGTAGTDVKPHSHAAESEHHVNLRKFWSERKYTNIDAKKIISESLGRDASWGQVTALEAEKMYKDREQLFPPKSQAPSAPPFEVAGNNPSQPPQKGDDSPKKCAYCGNDLVTMEITFSEKYKDKYQGNYFCFEHQSNDDAVNEVLNRKK